MATNVTTADASAPAHLRRVLGTWDLTWLCVVAILNLNLVPVVAANGPATVWQWAAALLFFFLPQGIAVVELSHRLPGEGGIYLWAKDQFGDFHGFVCGWCYWTTNMFFIPTLLFYMAGILAYAGGKATATLADNRVFFFLFTTALLWIIVALNIRGMGVGKWINNLGGMGTLVAAIILIALGLFSYFRFGSGFAPSAFAIKEMNWPLVSSFGVICFGLVGLELGSVMGDEIREPRRTVPRAVLWGGLLAGLFYVGSTLSLLLAVPQDKVVVVQGVLQAVDAMTHRVNIAWLLPPLALLMAASIIGATSAWMGGSARIMFVSGLDRYLPRVFGKIHPRYDTPHMALLGQAVLQTTIVSMSFIGASVKEAYQTLLDVAVVLQMVSYIYLYAALLRVALRGGPKAFFSAPVIWFGSTSGLIATVIGMIVAFVPSRTISSIWAFESKLVGCSVLFLLLAAGLFWYYSRQKAKVTVYADTTH